MSKKSVNTLIWFRQFNCGLANTIKEHWTCFNHTTNLPSIFFQHISGNPLNGFVEGCSAFLSALCEKLLMGDSHLRAIISYTCKHSKLPITLKKNYKWREQGQNTVKKYLCKKTLYKGNSTCHSIKWKMLDQVGIQIPPDCRRLAVKLLLVVNSFLY